MVTGVVIGNTGATRRWFRNCLRALPFMAFLAAAGIGLGPALGDDRPNGGIVHDGIDTQSNTRKGIDTQNNTRDGIDSSGIVNDGIDRTHDDTGLTNEGIDRDDLDDDTERPEAPKQPRK